MKQKWEYNILKAQINEIYEIYPLETQKLFSLAENEVKINK